MTRVDPKAMFDYEGYESWPIWTSFGPAEFHALLQLVNEYTGQINEVIGEEGIDPVRYEIHCVQHLGTPDEMCEQASSVGSSMLDRYRTREREHKEEIARLQEKHRQELDALERSITAPMYANVKNRIKEAKARA